MKKKKYGLVLLGLLILITIGIGIKAILTKRVSTIDQDAISNKQEPSETKSGQKNLYEKAVTKQKDSDKTALKYNVSQISFSKWNTSSGIPYSQVPGANLGITSFFVLDNNKIAFLSDASNEIIIINRGSGLVIKKFPVELYPRDFIFDDGLFYVLNETSISVYNINGENSTNFKFSQEFQGTVRISRFDKSTFLLLPSGNSLKIESRGSKINPKEYSGWITSSGFYIKTFINSENSYMVKIVFPNDKKCDKKFLNNKKLAGVFVVGTENNRIILDVQTFVSENPIKVERNIQIIDIKDDLLGSIISNIPVPDDNYYVLSNKDLYVSTDGIIYNLVTTPQGASIYSIIEIKN